MDSYFVYDRPVFEKDFVGRAKDVTVLDNLLKSGESVAIYSEPRTGKMSLIKKVLTNIRNTGQNLIVAEVSFRKARTTEDVVLTFADGLIRACGSSPAEYSRFVRLFLGGSHLVFDPEQFNTRGEVVSPTWIIDEVDIQKVFDLPSSLAAEKKTRIVVLITEFQNIALPEKSHALLTSLEKVIARADRQCPFIFTGTRLNAMKDIFDVHRWFWRTVVRFELTPFQPTEISDHIYKGFQMYGKSIEKELIMSSAQILRCNMWYVSHLFSIVDYIARGYVGERYVKEGLRMLTSIHEPRFYASICGLTDFQLSLLRAIIDGETRFASSTVIDKYHLNSSANVKRLKDALVKKEIVWFDYNDDPHIQDPLFELWLREDYFAR